MQSGEHNNVLRGSHQTLKPVREGGHREPVNRGEDKFKM